MRNTILREDTELLDEQGRVTSPGFACRSLWRYDRSRIQASRVQIKEWEYYLVMTDEFAAAFTLGDLGYLRMASISFLDLVKKTDCTRTALKPAGAPFLQEKVISWTGKDMMLRFETEGKSHHIWCWWKNFAGHSDFRADLRFLDEPVDSMNIVTPWADRKKFYYNTKINCMPAAGTIVCNWHVWHLDPEKDSGILDRGRGVWPYRIHWYWGTCSTMVDGVPFGFSIGYGFGDTSAASENVIFYDGRIHKLDDIAFEIPANPMLPWTVNSSDGRFEAVFTPELDRSARISALVVDSKQHQYFGRITGTAVLDDGRTIVMQDLRCAVEDIREPVLTMIRIAILEHEKETKDIVFLLSRVLNRADWVFRHYFKASELAKRMKEESYQIFIFDEIFKSPRMESVFVHDNPDAVFIYLCRDPEQLRAEDNRERIFYLGKDSLASGLESISRRLIAQSSQNDNYTLIYDGTHVNIPYQEIYYVEKIEKMVWFHTKKGVFHKRMNMSDLEKIFAPYGFLRVHVSYLVNRKHIRAWNKEDVELVTSALIPLSRAQKRKLRNEKELDPARE